MIATCVLVKFTNVFLVMKIYIIVHTSHLPRVVDLLGNEAVDDEQVEEGEETMEPWYKPVRNLARQEILNVFHKPVGNLARQEI